MNVRDCGEHELEDAERDGGNTSASRRGLVENTLQAEILCCRLVKTDAAEQL